MYHFTADHPPVPVRLSFRALIPGHIRQYLKDFQVDAIRFMHNFLAKGEFCVYNDESGLGKQAAIAVLLDAACSSRKCLIVVQNDDRYVTGWQFHFNVLSNTNVTVIKDEKDTTDSCHSIYIAKWSSLRTIDDLTKFKFDIVILDNRGQMLNNSFCTSMLLKQYERKINLLISSVDITSDLKLLHNVLRLGGRLDPQYSNFKIFEEKYKLPDAKELAYKRVDLEEYFCKRERLADYCKAFRLRRYCHQFETQLPLVREDRYKINVELWREKQNATNSESSSIEYVNHQNRDDEQIKDTQELFEEYCRQRRKQHLQFQQEEEQRLEQREREMVKNLEAEKEIIYNVDDEVALINDKLPCITENRPAARENSDEVILMSPLMVESDSDVDDIPEICNDSIADIEIVDLSSEEKGENRDQNRKDNSKQENNKQTEESSKNSISNGKFVKKKKASELERLKENIVDTLKIKEASTRLSRHAKREDNTIHKRKRIIDRLEEKPTSLANRSSVNLGLQNSFKSSEKSKTHKKSIENLPEESAKDSVKESKILVKESWTPPNNRNTLNVKNSSRNSKSIEKEKKSALHNINSTEIGVTKSALTSRKTRSAKNGENIPAKTSTKANNNRIPIKLEALEETIHTKKIVQKDSQPKVNSERIRLKREMEISPLSVHVKHTRSMQRLTRSASGSKYLRKHLSLQIDKINKTKKNTSYKKTPKSAAKNETKELNEDNTEKVVTNNRKRSVKPKKIKPVKNTQTSIISQRSSQDYESLQCAQRLSESGGFDNVMENTTEFLVPPTPTATLRNSLLPSSLTSSAGLFFESDIVFVPPSNSNRTTNRKRDQIILLSSSDNENSISQSSSTNISMTSRRTRALKPKRNQQHTAGATSKLSSFSDLLTRQNTRSSAKSPDLFSNCSDLIPPLYTQPNIDSQEPNTPFEGFKIFGSEVKQLQQHYAFNKNNIDKLNINLKKSHREQRSCLDILEKMFEPSNQKSKKFNDEKSSTLIKSSSRGAAAASKQKTYTKILPSHPIEAITEARHQQEIKKQKRSIACPYSALQDDEIFEITNNGTFGSVMRLHSNGDISPVQNTQKPNGKQHNKITNYLIGNTIPNASQEETTPNSGNSFTTEAGTPSKRHQQLSLVQNINLKKSPKSKCNISQSTKLTKWFTKPSELNSHEIVIKDKSSNSKKTTTKHMQINKEVHETIAILSSPPHTAGKRVLKRRRLELSFNK